MCVHACVLMHVHIFTYVRVRVLSAAQRGMTGERGQGVCKRGAQLLTR